MTATQELLRRHLSGEDVFGDVSQLVGADPTLAPLLGMLAQRQSGGQGDTATAEQARAASEDEAELRAHQEVVVEVRRQVESLRDELTGMRSTLEELAAALGACPSCVGADPLCVLCHGRGGPGWLPPDPARFAAYVVPAVRAHQFSVGRRQQGPPQHVLHHADSIPSPTGRGTT